MTSAKTQEKLKAQYVRLAQDSTSIKKKSWNFICLFETFWTSQCPPQKWISIQFQINTQISLSKSKLKKKL